MKKRQITILIFALIVFSLMLNNKLTAQTSDEHPLPAKSSKTEITKDTEKTIARQAGEWSAKTGGIGIAVHRGTAKEVTDQLIDAMQGALTRHGIESKVFVKNIDRAGSVFSFFVNNENYMTSGKPDEILALFPKMMEDYKIMHKEWEKTHNAAKAPSKTK